MLSNVYFRLGNFPLTRAHKWAPVSPKRGGYETASLRRDPGRFGELVVFQPVRSAELRSGAQVRK